MCLLNEDLFYSFEKKANIAMRVDQIESFINFKIIVVKG